MEIGLGTFTADRHPDDGRSHSELYGETLDLAQVAEDSGFDCVWVSEHHFTDGGYNPSVTSLLAALAAATEEIELGSNVALGPMYKQPVRLAEDLAVVDNIADGRLTFGVANGYRVEEFEVMGVPLEERPLRLHHLVKILRKAWHDDPLVHEGHERLDGAWEFDGVNVTPKPEQDGGPDIILGGFAEPAVERAARIGDGYSVGALTGLEMAQNCTDVYWNAVEEVGKNREDQTYVLWNCGFLHDEKEPEAVVGKHWQQFKDQYGDWYYEAGQIDDPRALHDAYDANAMFYSDPDEMAAKINEYKEMFGDDMHFIYQAAFPSLDYEDFKYSIELFGQEVIPQIT